jgi:CBS domain-containing protein
MDVRECELREVLECNKDISVFEVAKLLRDNQHRHIIVTEDKKPLGIISITDINNKVVAEKQDVEKTKAEDIMTKNLFTLENKTSLERAYIEMIRENLFSCPVVEEGKLKGMLDIRVIMNHLAEHKENGNQKSC